MPVSKDLVQQLLRWQEARKSLDDKRRALEEAQKAHESARREKENAEERLAQLAGFCNGVLAEPRCIQVGDTAFLLCKRNFTCVVTETRIERCADGPQGQGNESQGPGVPTGEAREAAPAKKAQSRQGAKAPPPAK